MKNIIIVFFVLIICSQQYEKIENIQDDGICIYLPNDILYILPNSNTIETECGEIINFANRKQLSQFLEEKTSNMANNAISQN